MGYSIVWELSSKSVVSDIPVLEPDLLFLWTRSIPSPSSSEEVSKFFVFENGLVKTDFMSSSWSEEVAASDPSY